MIVVFYSRGLYFRLDIVGGASAEQFMPMWQHILATFVPGPPVPGANQCG